MLLSHQTHDLRRWSKMTALTALLVLASFVAAPSPYASATPALVTDSYQLAGSEPLALAGSATLVAGYGGDDEVVRSFGPSQSPAVIARVHPEGEGDGQIVLAGSPSRIALLETGVLSSGYKDCCSIFYQHVASGPLVGPLEEPTAGCPIAPSLDPSVDSERGIAVHSAIALDGEVLAYDSFGCLIVEDFASGLQRIVPLAATLEPVHERGLRGLPQGALLRVAGRLVAYRANPPGGEGPASVVVYDIDTGSEVYSVPLPAENAREPGRIAAPTFDLQSDGTLVIADPATCSAAVSTIAAPSPRPLGIPACYVRRVRDGRVLVVAPGSGDERVLEWSLIEAPLAHPIADLGSDGYLETVPPDMNETTVLYELSGCYPRVYSAPLAEPGTPPALPNRCPVSVSPLHATLTAKSLSVSLRCPLGCRGSFTAWLRTAKEMRAGEVGQQIGSEPYTGEPARNSYSLAPGQSQTFKLLPTGEYEEHPTVRGLERELRRHPQLRLELFFETDTPDAEGLFEQEAEELKIPMATSSRVSLPIVAARR